MSEDLSHDTHLRAALRHAPDHALAPPAGVSQTILAAARQLHRPARAAPAAPVRVAPARTRPWAAWLQTLASPRWAGGLATGLVAALGLGLWLDLGQQPVVESLHAPPQVEARSAQAAPAAPPPTTASADSATDADAPQAQTAPPQRPEPAPQRSAEQRAAAAAAHRVERAERQVQEASALSKSAPAASPAAPAAPTDADRSARSSASPAAPSTRAPTPAPAPPAPAATMEPGAQAMAQGSAGGAPASRDAAPLGAWRKSLDTARAATPAEPVAVASPAWTLLRRARAESASGSARWLWQAPGMLSMAPFDDEAQAWLLRLVQASRGRWADVTERAGAGDALEVRWWRDAWPHATLRIETNGLRWIEAGGRIRYAPLEASALQRLRTF